MGFARTTDRRQGVAEPWPGTAEDVAVLHHRILRRDVRVGVIGLGYVGLPLARAIAECGFAVTGFDTDQRKVEQLSRGFSYIRDVPDAAIVPLAAPALDEADAVLICTDHDAIDYRMLAERARLVVDTRNACAGSTAGTIVRA